MRFSEILKEMDPTQNQEGFVLVTAMLILIVVTMLGLAASNTAYFETIIAGSERQYQEQFFKADAGINAVLAEDAVPANSFLPSFYTATANGPFVDCNNSGDQPPFTGFDLDGDGNDDVSLYLLEKGGSPAEIQVASCASQGASVTAQIIAGIQYGTPPGAAGGTGDILEYNSF